MGKVYDSLLSGTSGRTGRIVVANLFGNEYTRIRPRKRTGLPSQKQLLIQDRLKAVLTFMASYRRFTCDYFGRRIGVKSRYNIAMSNVLDAYQLDFDNSEFTRQNLAVMFAKGGLLGVIPETLTSDVANSFTFTWSDNSGTNPEREADKLQLLYAVEQENESYFLENVATRVDQTYTVTVLPYFSGKTIHVWAAFIQENPRIASNSVYLGSVLIS